MFTFLNLITNIKISEAIRKSCLSMSVDKSYGNFYYITNFINTRSGNDKTPGIFMK